VRQHANLGLHAVLHQFTEVGEGAMVGACAFAKGKLEPFTTYVGVPAKPIGANHRKVAALLAAARANPADPSA
jgi:acetyltransferase-like isoleucine patch superfamily enzyme